MSNNVKNFAFSINRWLSDHIHRAGDSLTCLFKLVQSIFLIYGFNKFYFKHHFDSLQAKIIRFWAISTGFPYDCHKDGFGSLQKCYVIKNFAFSFTR